MWLYQKLVKTCTNWIGNFCRFVFQYIPLRRRAGASPKPSFSSCERSVLSLSGGPTSVFSLLSPPPLVLFLFLPLPPCARSQADATRGRRSHGGTIRVMSKIRMKGREARGGMGGERESVVGEIPNFRRVFVLNLNSVGKSRKKEEEKRDRATPALSLARSRAPWRPPVVLFV